MHVNWNGVVAILAVCSLPLLSCSGDPGTVGGNMQDAIAPAARGDADKGGGIVIVNLDASYQNHDVPMVTPTDSSLATIDVAPNSLCGNSVRIATFTGAEVWSTMFRFGTGMAP